MTQQWWNSEAAEDINLLPQLAMVSDKEQEVESNGGA